jgi:hypothetical protein
VGVPALLLFVFIFLLVRIKLRSSETAAEKVASVLKVYAERGEEPPPAVNDALMALIAGSGAKASSSGPASAAVPAPAAPPPPQLPLTREQHFSAFARDLVMGSGAAAIAWWRAPDPGDHPGGFMTLAVIAALLFAAGAVGHLVTALQMRDGR